MGGFEVGGGWVGVLDKGVGVNGGIIVYVEGRVEVILNSCGWGGCFVLDWWYW